MTGSVARTPTLAALEAMAGGPPAVHEPTEIVREITSDDLPVLADQLVTKSWSAPRPTNQISVLRTSHHMLAQLVATGMATSEAAFLCGRSVSSVNSLCEDDPAFRELLAYYREQQTERDFNAYDRLVMLGATAMDVLQERIEQNPERFGNTELIKVIESTMDRSAAPAKGGGLLAQRGAQTGGLNVSINFVAPDGTAQAVPSTIELKAEEVK